MQNSSDPKLAEFAKKTQDESTYHLRHSRAWVVRLGDGTEESHRRMQDAVDILWRFTGELITPDDTDHIMAEAGIGPEPDQLASNWREMVNEVLTQATLTPGADDAWMYMGGKHGEHTEHLGFILAEMQFLQRAYPDATTW